MPERCCQKTFGVKNIETEELIESDVFMETAVSEGSEYHYEINILTNSSSIVWKIAQMSLLLIICSIRK